jgi:methyl-accepting chemotaxis protein
MTFKTRVALSFGLLITLTAGLGGLLMINALREEKAFRLGRNALREQFMAQEIDYFMNKKIKALETYVMLEEELEKIVIDEAESVLKKKFQIWEEWTKTGDASKTDLTQVREIHLGLRQVEEKALGLMDKDAKATAMGLVGGEFRKLSKAAREKLREITAKKVQDAVSAERTMTRVVRQTHMTSIAGVLLAIIVGVALAMSIYNSVMLPMKVIAMWSEQIAKGHLHMSLNLPANSEMGRLAGNFNQMIQSIASRYQEQVVTERAHAQEALEREKALERQRLEDTLQHQLRVKEEEAEQISTLEDAVDGFREILDIMGAAPTTPREKKKG